MAIDKRKESRYPGIYLSLLFSPTAGEHIKDLAESYLHASSHDMSVGGMSFDVSVQIPVDSPLVVSVPNEQGPNDELKAIVSWCREIEGGNYRVGVFFDIEAGIQRPAAETDFIPVLDGPGIPSEAILVCPACLVLNRFTYKGLQKYHSGSELPLYDCGACGSTRSITSLLSFNRQRRKNEVE